MTVNPADFIGGAAQVVDYYGMWPTFHDADYVAICIEMDDATITISFRLYDWNDTVQRANRPSISLCWHGAEDLVLTGIQELGQNAIGQMQITQTSNAGIFTSLQPAGDGTTVIFRAKSVRVTHFDPHEEWDYETRNTAVD